MRTNWKFEEKFILLSLTKTMLLQENGYQFRLSANLKQPSYDGTEPTLSLLFFLKKMQKFQTVSNAEHSQNFSSGLTLTSCDPPLLSGVQHVAEHRSGAGGEQEPRRGRGAQLQQRLPLCPGVWTAQTAGELFTGVTHG